MATEKVEQGYIYGVAEAAALLGLNRDSLYRLCKAREIRHRRIGPRGGRIEFEGRWLCEYLRACEVCPSGRHRPPAPTTPKAPRPRSKPRPERAPAWRAKLEAELGS